MQFKPNFDLIVPWEDAIRPLQRMPYVAVFRKDNKVLVYACDKHMANISFDMVDFCFGENAPAVPQIAVVEYRNSGRTPGSFSFQDNSLTYAAAVADKKGLPVVFADLSDEEMLNVLRRHFPDRGFIADDLRKILTAGGPSKKKGEYNMLDWSLEMYGRDPFMISNIAAALNKYDVVFAIFGEGHYRSHRLVLEDMMGTPEYIIEFPNTRADFSGMEIKPIILVEFDSGK